MQHIAEQIFAIIQDYHCDEPTGISVESILAWVNQFDKKDRVFILEEFLHLLRQGIYVSKQNAKEFLWLNFEKLARQLGYREDFKKFILESHFLDVQNEDKSQYVLVRMLDEIIRERLDVGLNTDDSEKRNYIYIDDIIGTGKTVLGGLDRWLSDGENLKKVISGEYNICISVFCMHQWAADNIKWALKMRFSKDELRQLIRINYNYLIDNRVSYPSAKLNFLLPLRDCSNEAHGYLESIQTHANKNFDKAFRLTGKPTNETFFSSPENRNRFEKIFLEKGLEILGRVSQISPAHRPLGDTYPSYRTLGTGTLFFTWRNISNTCPLVLWWDIPAHGWKGLFPLKNRGK